MGDIKIPTCGRIVHYYEVGETTPNAAIVTEGGDLAPSLVVFTKYTGSVVKLSVQHKSLVEEMIPKPAYWDWPEIK